MWGATIYQLGMWSVGAVASAYAIRAARAGDPSPLNAACVLWALILWGWLIGWNYGPPGALHAAAHLALAIWFMSRPANWQVVLGVLMLVCAIADAANLIGAFPPRPRVFTGFYYPDVLAFMTHAAFVLIGAASNDGATTRGRSLGHWLRRSVDRHAYRMAVSSKDRKSD
ncbi:MAG: hypothetical protein IPL91_15000 [Hyphomicrobium sp.]|nr:hypothetical protein [Hyphomicrobium sp.]